MTRGTRLFRLSKNTVDRCAKRCANGSWISPSLTLPSSLMCRPRLRREVSRSARTGLGFYAGLTSSSSSEGYAQLLRARLGLLRFPVDDNGLVAWVSRSTIVPALLSTGRQHVPTFVGD